MLYYKVLSLAAEIANKTAAYDNPFVYNSENDLISTYFTSTCVHFVPGYNFEKNNEISVRYTSIKPTKWGSNDVKEYTIGLSKYFVKHKLDIQTNVIYRNTLESNEGIFSDFIQIYILIKDIIKQQIIQHGLRILEHN